VHQQEGLVVRPDEDGGERAFAMLGPGEVLESKDLGHVLCSINK
jgi:hypothetical protein